MGKLPSASEFMDSIRVQRLTKLTREQGFIGRWVPVKEALPPERLGVLLARNDLDSPAFGYLKYAAGEPDSPYFVCPAYAGLASRNATEPGDAIATTHWYSPTEDGLPIETCGLFSDIGLGPSCWCDTSEDRRQA